MIAENFLELIKLKSKKYRKNKEIFDIVLYGSSAKGKREANDIDVLFIFHKLPLEKRINITQDFKKKLTKIKKIDIKSINLDEFFDQTFIARQGVLIEGISLINGKPLSSKMGFSGFGLFSYKTAGLSNNNKVRFFYALNGRRGDNGFLKRTGAEKISNGVILVPIINTDLFSEFLRKWKMEFNIKKILISEYK